MEAIWEAAFQTRHQQQQLQQLDTTTINNNNNNNNNNRCRCEDDARFVEDNGHRTCIRCGWVATNTIIDTGREWNYYQNDDRRRWSNPARAAKVNPLLPKSSVGSWATVTYKTTYRPNWLKRQHWGMMGGPERRQKKVYQLYDEISQRLGIPSMATERAKYYYKAVSDSRLSRNKAIRVSCLYYACKDCGIARDGKELAKAMEFDLAKVARSNKTFLQIMKRQRSSASPSTLQAKDYVVRKTRSLGLPYWINQEILLVLRNVRRIGLISNRSPVTMAATCVYFTAHQYGYVDITLQDINRAFGVRTKTYLNAYHTLMDNDYLLFLKDEYFEDDDDKYKKI